MNDILNTLFESPELAAIAVPGLFNKYKPVIYAALKEVLVMYKDLAANDDYMKTSASYTWNRYKSYINAGFSEEQAFALIINDRDVMKEAVKNTKVKYTKE